MGQVVPFVARVRDSGDWTAAERARLEALAGQLSDAGIKVDVVFGATDAGDPWCVVTDENGDVLIHVARIGGVFVIHSAVDDVISEDVDLNAALRDHLDTAAAEPASSATILPFGLTARQGQTFLALVAASAFFYETLGDPGIAEAAEAPPVPSPDEPVLAPPEHDAPAQEREVAAQATVLHEPQQDAAPVAVERPADEQPAPLAAVAEPELQQTAPAAPQATPVEAAPAETVAAAAPVESQPLVIRGTDGDDLLVGTAADERIEGGAGNDTLIGGGGHDTLVGGAGDDRIVLTPDAVAIGGQGADTFVIKAPIHPNHPGTLLGVILDFSDAEGDRLVNWRGEWLRFDHNGQMARPGDGGTGSDRPTPGDHFLTLTATTTTVGGDGSRTGGPTTTDASTFTRVEVDLDGDGTADGYILLGHTAQWQRPEFVRLDPQTGDPPITLAGHTSTAPADFGG